MDGKSTLFAFAAYLTIVLVLVAVASVAILHFGLANYFAPYKLAESTPANAPTSTPPPVRSVELVAPPNPGAPTSPGLEQRIQVLEAMVEQKNKQLRALAQQLESKNRALARLRAEYDETTATMVEMLGESAADDRSKLEDAAIEQVPGEPAQESAPRGAGAAAANTEDMQNSLSARIEQLQNELNQANQELAALQLQMLTEAANAQLHARQVDQAVVTLLGSIGTSAVPALIRALDDANPEVRRWAASALGRIGPDADDAVPALTDALTDDDENVRKAASAALESVGR